MPKNNRKRLSRPRPPIGAQGYSEDGSRATPALTAYITRAGYSYLHTITCSESYLTQHTNELVEGAIGRAHNACRRKWLHSAIDSFEPLRASLESWDMTALPVAPVSVGNASQVYVADLTNGDFAVPESQQCPNRFA